MRNRFWQSGPSASLLIVLLLLAGCGAQPTSPAASPAPTPAPAAAEVARQPVPEAEVLALLDAVQSDDYTVVWHVLNPPEQADFPLLMVRSGRAGIFANGDIYVTTLSGSFAHKGGQSWYFTGDGKGGVRTQGPYDGRIPQLPGINSVEAVKPEEFGLLNAIRANSLSFVRSPAADGVAGVSEWVSTVPVRKSSVHWMGENREVVSFRLWVKQFDETALPIRYQLTWWEGGPVIVEGMYDYTPAFFPELKTQY